MGKLTVRSVFYNITVPLAPMLNDHIFSERSHDIMENFLGNQVSSTCIINSFDQMLVISVS